MHIGTRGYSPGPLALGGRAAPRAIPSSPACFGRLLHPARPPAKPAEAGSRIQRRENNRHPTPGPKGRAYTAASPPASRPARSRRQRPLKRPARSRRVYRSRNAPCRPQARGTWGAGTCSPAGYSTEPAIPWPLSGPQPSSSVAPGVATRFPGPFTPLRPRAQRASGYHPGPLALGCRCVNRMRAAGSTLSPECLSFGGLWARSGKVPSLSCPAP